MSISEHFKDLSFKQPEWFWLLLALLPLVLLRNKLGTRNSITFSSLSILGTLGHKPRRLAGALATTFLALSVLFAVIALARPRTKTTYSERNASGVDIIIAMDVSTSMKIDDFIINGRKTPRDYASREVVKSFIKNRPNDRIGIIPFAGQPYMESPITLEHPWLLTKIDNVRPRNELSQGTAIGSAIAASAVRLDRRSDTKSRLIILITDGSNNALNISPIQAATNAKELGIKIYTVAIGTKEGRLPSHIQPFPSPEFDTETLEEIAEITGAEYFRARSTDDLVDSFKSIDLLEKTERKRKEFTNYREHHHHFTLAATLSLLVYLTALSLKQPPGPE